MRLPGCGTFNSQIHRCGRFCSVVKYAVGTALGKQAWEAVLSPHSQLPSLSSHATAAMVLCVDHHTAGLEETPQHASKAQAPLSCLYILER